MICAVIKSTMDLQVAFQGIFVHRENHTSSCIVSYIQLSVNTHHCEFE